MWHEESGSREGEAAFITERLNEAGARESEGMWVSGSGRRGRERGRGGRSWRGHTHTHAGRQSRASLHPFTSLHVKTGRQEDRKREKDNKRILSSGKSLRHASA